MNEKSFFFDDFFVGGENVTSNVGRMCYIRVVLHTGCAWENHFGNDQNCQNDDISKK